MEIYTPIPLSHNTPYVCKVLYIDYVIKGYLGRFNRYHLIRVFQKNAFY